ncbi:MAG: hypothetical protein HC785_16360 [Calothrix sp. CSU_2_0]|nr:hypothetical protein [Calothrix sp. CSU_2_0]
MKFSLDEEQKENLLVLLALITLIPGICLVQVLQTMQDSIQQCRAEQVVNRNEQKQ